MGVNKLDGYVATADAYEGTWIDGRGNTRVSKLEPDGDYNRIRDKRQRKQAEANRAHQRWCKRFMKQAEHN